VIIEGILHIARGMGIRVVAEGVETRQQANLLSERGCELAQGYLYSKPCPRQKCHRSFCAVRKRPVSRFRRRHPWPL
jgi:EAL domain-containing protein (putative c-di-GMP-specific phosphodiesterase class I)